MATIEKRQRQKKDGSKGPVHYRARVWTPMGERSETFDKFDDAKTWAKAIEGDLTKGAFVDPRKGRRTFGDYAREWQASQVHRPGTADKVESNLRLHVLPWFEDKPLQAIRPGAVQAWVKNRSAVMHPSTLEVIYAYVVAIFRAAVEDQLLHSSPCTKAVKLPRKPKVNVEPPSTDEVEAILGQLPDRYRTLAVVAAGAGLRSGEVLGLTVPRVDFLRGTVRVEHQLLLPNAGELRIGPPKTDASHRSVPLPAIVVEHLAEHLSRFPAVNVELLDLTTGKPEPVRRRHDLIFTNERHAPIRRNRFHEIWTAAVGRATVKIDGKRQPVNQAIDFHDFRHYYASLLIRHGESVKVVQARLGHASAMETLDTYGHLWPDSEERTRDAVQEVLGHLGSSAPITSLGPHSAHGR